MTTATCAQSQIWNLREVARAKRGGFYFYGNYSVELLMVGGGGGGVAWNAGAGGGGAGGLIYTNSLPVRAGTCYPITIGGGGGAGGAGGGCGGRTCLVYNTGSTCVNLIALGGGNGYTGTGGQPEQADTPTPTIPAATFDFGSGGGGGSPRAPTPTAFAGYTQNGTAGRQNCAACWWCNLPGICGYGCPGGNSFSPSPTVTGWGGGGGGACAAGTNGSPSPCCAGSGGAGLCFAISGISVGYAGGGGAGVPFSFAPGQPCAGCGGCGAINFGGSGFNNPATDFCGPFPPEGQGCLIYNASGVANRGGGGASGFNFGPRLGAGASAGGSGVVIIRYEGQQRATGGSTVSAISSPTPATVHTYTGTGCFIA
jgi:hypothetical protein